MSPAAPSTLTGGVGGRARGPAHARPRTRRRWGRRIALVLAGMMAVMGMGACATYHSLRSAITVSDAGNLLEASRPQESGAATILVIGTDYRGGANRELAGEGGEFFADSTLLIHLAPDRHWMEILSIARDTLVDIPACPRLDGTVSGAVNGAMFNSAFSRGGGPERDLTSAVACTMATVEYNTGVHITDHVVLDMAGVVAVVDALGGVHVDLPEPVVGNHHVDLDLPGGPQVLDGWQSLNFIRARGGSGMGLHTGSDLMRIERQQFFLNAVMATVVDQDLMTNLAVLYRVATGALNALTTSPGLASPVAVANLGRAMADMDPSHVVFTVVPVLPAPSDPHRVVWVQPDVGQMWERIAAGEAPDFPINERTD